MKWVINNSCAPLAAKLTIKCFTKPTETMIFQEVADPDRPCELPAFYSNCKQLSNDCHSSDINPADYDPHF